jgi:hypothetical protein
MAVVVSGVAPSLKGRRFKKQRHTFNRIAELGLVHVVNFQMGQFPIGAYEIPGLRPNLYGKFTVNLGVFVREVYEITQRGPAPAFVQEYACEFRVRLGELLMPPADTWWSLTDDSSALVAELAALLEGCGQAWFEQYATRDAIVRVPDGPAQPAGWPRRAGVALAIMLAHRGDRAGARASLRDYLAKERRDPRNPRHRDWVLEVAARLGFERGEVE